MKYKYFAVKFPCSLDFDEFFSKKLEFYVFDIFETCIEFRIQNPDVAIIDQSVFESFLLYNYKIFCDQRQVFLEFLENYNLNHGLEINTNIIKNFYNLNNFKERA